MLRQRLGTDCRTWKSFFQSVLAHLVRVRWQTKTTRLLPSLVEMCTCSAENTTAHFCPERLPRRLIWANTNYLLFPSINPGLLVLHINSQGWEPIAPFQFGKAFLFLSCHLSLSLETQKQLLTCCQVARANTYQWLACSDSSRATHTTYLPALSFMFSEFCNLWLMC